MYYAVNNILIGDLFVPIKISIINQLLFKLNSFKDNLILLVILTLLLKNIKKSYLVIFFGLFTLIHLKKKQHTILNSFYLGYYKIHPPLFYWSLMISFWYFSKKTTLLTNIYKISWLTIISFMWGSLWALYQIIWGKYWSNDYIEIVLIYNYTLILLFIHKIKEKKLNPFFYIFNGFLILLFLRFNLLYTKHNFFNKKKNNLFYIKLVFYSFFIKITLTLPRVITSIKNFSLLTFSLITGILLNLLNILHIVQLIKNIFLVFLIKFIFKVIVFNKKLIVHLLKITIVLIFLNFSLVFYKKNVINYNLIISNNIPNYYFQINNNFYLFKKKIKKIFYYFIKNSYTYVKDINYISHSKVKKNYLINTI